MYPGVEDVWTIFVRGRNPVVFQVFKAHIPRKAEQRNGHTPGMNVPGSFHEAGVVAHAAVQLHQGVDARSLRADANRLEIPPQLQLTTAISDKSASGSDLAYAMRKEMSPACALIPSRSSVISRVATPMDGLARTT